MIKGNGGLMKAAVFPFVPLHLWRQYNFFRLAALVSASHRNRFDIIRIFIL